MIVIGIDFGTGNSSLAYWQGKKAHVFALHGQTNFPSDVLVKGEEIDADPAHLSAPPAGWQRVHGIKRVLLNPNTSAKAREQAIRQATARLRWLYEAFQKANPEETILSAVLTCPANASQAYRELLMEIGRAAGLPRVAIVDEPTAAGVHHGLGDSPAQDERWLVVDWGCGTCDVSLLERKARQKDLLVKCIHGDNKLGGMDMDELLRQHLAQKYAFEAALCTLWEVEALKIQLSETQSTAADLHLTNGKIVPVTLQRTELETCIAPLLERAVSLVQSALQEAHWRAGAVQHVIVTGGPLFMPLVRSVLAEATDREEEELLWEDPLTSVALGAAHLAELKRTGSILVPSKVAQSIGVRVVQDGSENAYHALIQRGEDRPVKRQVTLSTSVDLQDIVKIEIREGDNLSAEANPLLGTLDVLVRPESKGVVKVRLAVSLNESGALEALVEPLGDAASVRQVQRAGIRVIERGGEVARDTAVQDDPLDEFERATAGQELDPDSVRQLYERLKIKYHPDRQPERREYWAGRLQALDTRRDECLAEIERRVRASTLPDLDALEGKVVVDEISARRLVHCLAEGIGEEKDRPRLETLLRRYADYRRVLAAYLVSYLRQGKTNSVLQTLLTKDDRPHVGLVVLLQNVPDKPLRERHEVLKAAYRLKEERVRELLRAPDLKLDSLYQTISKEAPQATNPITGQTAPTANAPVDTSKLKVEHRNGNTYISGNTYPIKERLKALGCRWDGTTKSWYATGKIIKPEDI